MKYPYENLGPDLFQEFVQSLLLNMNPDVICYPVGQADGGRDALTATPDGEGFIVYQVKYSRDPSKIKDPYSWLEASLKAEIKNIRELFNRGAKKYYLITNVRGTAKQDSGTMDKVEEIFKKLGIKNSICLWRDDVDRRLDGIQSLRWAYPELITGMDMLQVLVENGLAENKIRRSRAIKAFLRNEFQRDEKVRFKQVDLQNDLLKLFIDVPIEAIDDDTEENTSFKNFLLNSVASRARRRDEAEIIEVDEIREVKSRKNVIGTARFLLDKLVGTREPTIVLEGGPGQGKSTLTQYISQVHRARLLKEDAFLDELPKSHLSQPVRLPFRIDLRDLSSWLEGNNPFRKKDREQEIQDWLPSVESFLAKQITEFSGGTRFSVDDLLDITSISPVIIIFDGLDEVPDIEQRHRVVDSIVESIDRMTETSMSLQAIVTTRPAAFSNAPGLPKSKYSAYKLGFVTKSLAKEYAKKWSSSKNLDEKDSEDLYNILDDKLTLPHLNELAKNPMQLTILLSLIHSRGVSLPDKRTSLYDRYVDLFFNRESEKSSIIRTHRDLVISVHQYLAWILHSEAEKGSQGRIEYDRIQCVLKTYLEGEGHDPGLVDEIFHGMVERVVFLVSRVEGTFEFEVQPLREYFAGRYLYDTAPYSPAGEELSGTLPDRFDGMCRNFYWLNCVRFFSGCYNKGELHSLIDRLEAVLEDGVFKYLAHPRHLAVLLLSDWVFSQYPRSVDRVVKLLFKDGGIKFLGNGVNSRSFLFKDTLILPEGCGRKQLLAFCESELMALPAADYADILTGIVEANITPLELKSLTDRLIDKSVDEKAQCLLKYIAEISGFSQFDDDALDRLEESFVDVPEFYEAVLKSGRYEYIYKCSKRLEGFIFMHMKGDVSSFPMPTYDSNIKTLIFFLEPAFFAFLLNQVPDEDAESSQSLNTWLEKFLGASFKEVDEKTVFSSHKVKELIELFSKEFGRSVKVWRNDLSPYDVIVNGILDRFGVSPKLVQIACVAAGIKNKDIRCTDAQNLFDSNISLIRRVRYARLRAGNVTWWKKTLLSAGSDEHYMLAIFVFVFWSSGKTFSKLLSEFSDALNMVSHDFRKIIMAAFALGIGQNFSGSRRISPKSELFEDVSNLGASTLALASIRFDKPGRQRLIELVLGGFEFSSSSEWRLIMKAVFSALNDRSDSSYQISCLKAISICYLASNDSQIPFYRYHGLGANGSLISSESAAKYVIDNINKFPVFLVLHAEAFYRGKVANNISSVLDVSEREDWFQYKQ